MRNSFACREDVSFDFSGSANYFLDVFILIFTLNNTLGTLKRWRITMAVQRTLSIIKPDATRRNLTGAINKKIEGVGLRIIAQKRIKLSKEQAGIFYLVHKGRPFYDELCEFMASEPIVVQVLEGEDAILENRKVMGATNPVEADDGTIRKEFALSIGENSVHGSDGETTAAFEISYFFSGLELVG